MPNAPQEMVYGEEPGSVLSQGGESREFKLKFKLRLGGHLAGNRS